MRASLASSSTVPLRGNGARTFGRSDRGEDLLDSLHPRDGGKRTETRGPNGHRGRLIAAADIDHLAAGRSKGVRGSSGAMVETHINEHPVAFAQETAGTAGGKAQCPILPARRKRTNYRPRQLSKPLRQRAATRVT